jgi:uncharacterized protein
MQGFRAAALVVLLTAMAACTRTDVDADLLKASEDGKVQQVKALLDKGAHVDTRDAYQRTPLMLSAFGGHQEIAAALIKAGADIHATAKYGQTALMFAVERGNDAIATLLRAAGADS